MIRAGEETGELRAHLEQLATLTDVPAPIREALERLEVGEEVRFTVSRTSGGFAVQVEEPIGSTHLEHEEPSTPSEGDP